MGIHTETFSMKKMNVKSIAKVCPIGMKVNICKSVVPIDSATATTTAVVVPAGSYFVAGDYRGGSIDSRSQGCVAADSIIGKGVKRK